jgi:alpha-1,2-mannosyltransferase
VVVRPLTAARINAPRLALPPFAATSANLWFCAVLPLATALATLWIARDHLAVDLHHAFRPAAEAVLMGRSPYPPATVEALGTGTAFVYLPFAAFVFLPFALLDASVADLAGTLVVTAAGAAALWVLGVRDWRCYSVALASMPVLAAIQTANLTLLLTLALAGVWATRSRRAAPGLLLALTLASKLFLWPMLVWLAATRRYRAAAYAVSLTILLVIGTWAVLGFADAREYPGMLRLLADLEERESYTLFAVASDLHVPEPMARLVGAALACGALGGSWLLGRRGDDVRSFTLAICATLLFTPILWLHYFVLLFVPVAIVHKRLSPLWALPLATWFYATGQGNGTTARTALVLATFAALVAAVMRTRPQAVARAT